MKRAGPAGFFAALNHRRPAGLPPASASLIPRHDGDTEVVRTDRGQSDNKDLTPFFSPRSVGSVDVDDAAIVTAAQPHELRRVDGVPDKPHRAVAE